MTGSDSKWQLWRREGDTIKAFLLIWIRKLVALVVFSLLHGNQASGPLCQSLTLRRRRATLRNHVSTNGLPSRDTYKKKSARSDVWDLSFSNKGTKARQDPSLIRKSNHLLSNAKMKGYKQCNLQSQGTAAFWKLVQSWRSSQDKAMNLTTPTHAWVVCAWLCNYWALPCSPLDIVRATETEWRLVELFLL